jgi:phosphohistidine phosphatase
MGEERRVLVVRHGIAQESGEAERAGIADADRALTDTGIHRTRAAAAGLRSVASRLDAIAHSPLRRARETADLLSAAYAAVRKESLPALAPDGAFGDIYEWIGRFPCGTTVALVGHEPSLGLWISDALGGGGKDFVIMKKAGACLLEYEARPGPAGARLHWLLPPRILRALS